MKKTFSILLSGLALALLASCSSVESDNDVFFRADKNKDGRLSLDEVNQEGLPRLFNLYDVNKDGAVTWQEALQADPNVEKKLFLERDLNKDGKVTYAESEKVALSKGELKKQFAAVDTNGNGYIDKDEAEAFVARRAHEATWN